MSEVLTPAPPRAHGITALAVASFLCFGALLVLFGANSPELIANLDLDYADLGLVGSMLSLGLGVGIMGAGPVSDRYPRRPLYLAACLVVAVATTTLGPSTSYTALLVHTFALGLGAGFYETVLNALIVEEFGERAPRRLIFVHAAATLAASATPLLFEALREFWPLAWHQSFGIVGFAHVGLMLTSLAVPMRDAPRKAANTPASPALRVLPDDRLALMAVCVTTFAYVGVESALTLFIVDHTTSNLGFDATSAARTISAFWGGLLVGRLAIGFSPRPIGAGTTAVLASFAAAITLAFGLGFIGAPDLAMAAIGFFLGGVFPVMIGMAGIALPSSAGTAVGLAGGLGSLGGFIVPWLTGRIALRSGLGVGLASLGGWLALLVVGALVVRLRVNRGKAESHAEA